MKDAKPRHDEASPRSLKPKLATEACQKFLAEHHKIIDFSTQISTASYLADAYSTTLREISQIANGEDPDKVKLDVEKDGLGAIQRLRSHRQLIFELMLCRATDNFLIYISDLLTTIFRSNTSTLKSNEDKVSFDWILQHGSMDELIASIVERKVNDLAYKGMKELNAYLNSRLKFNLFPTDNEFRSVVRVVEFRNLIVHNRGIVNKIILDRLPDLGLKPGMPLVLKFDSCFSDIEYLAKSALDIDKRGSEKFKLTRHALAEPNSR